jgi:hypothetical protein
LIFSLICALISCFLYSGHIISWNLSSLTSGLFFYDPNVSDEKFQEIVWTEYKKEELKEQIKENINEEIELEEMEEKEGKKSKQNKWDKSKDVKFKERKVGESDKKSLWDTIKWWFK